MDLPDAIDAIRPSAVQIRLAPSDAILGTGFFVDEAAHVITAKHVIDGGRGVAQAVGQPPVFSAGLAAPNIEGADVGPIRGLTMIQNFTFIGATVVDEDAGTDLALLRLDHNPFAGEIPVMIRAGDEAITSLYGVARPNTTRPREGISVAVSGYPLSSDALVTNAGCVASAWVRDPASVAMLGVPTPGADVSDRYLADLEVNGGNSGGPVYTQEEARVIGVCVATQSALVRHRGEPVVINGQPLVYSSGLTVVVPSKYVVELLQRNGVTWGSGEVAEDGPNGASSRDDTP